MLELGIGALSVTTYATQIRKGVLVLVLGVAIMVPGPGGAIATPADATVAAPPSDPSGPSVPPSTGVNPTGVNPAGAGARDRLAVLNSAHPLVQASRLDSADLALYQQVFQAQATGAWEAADAALARLHDRRLLGTALAQRYLQRGYRASYDELRAWLKRYADHAGAGRIYALAQARQAGGDPSPPEPADLDPLDGSLESRALWGDHEVAPRNRIRNGTTSGPITDRIDTFLREGRPSAALRVLDDDDVTRRMSSEAFDGLRARVGAALFYSGNTHSALVLSSASAARSGAVLPTAHWIAGLALWRQNRTTEAGSHFAAIADTEGLSPWRVSAAAYWAGRAELRLGHRSTAEHWLERAAAYPRTFYGLLALRALGREGAFQWEVPRLTPHHVAELAETGAGYRALALLQLNQVYLAEQELRRLRPGTNAILAEALVALADAAGLPALALQVGNAVATPEGGIFDAALYPLPHWAPPEGFTVDPALLFAIMRQESRFEPRLISRAGATGVMQVMLETARDVVGVNVAGAEDLSARRHLFDPQWNLMVAQRYVGSLLASPPIAGNLFHLATAYNAGPGTVIKWHHDLEGIDDPLLYLESIPIPETRNYLHKVLTNYWIYQKRLGQPSPTLDALVTNQWPIYHPMPQPPLEVAAKDAL